MAVYFNELTLDQDSQQNLRLLDDLRAVWLRFCQASDGRFKKLITTEVGMEQLSEAMRNCANRDMRAFFYHIFVQKFRDRDVDEYTEDSNDYFNGAEYHVTLMPSGERVECKTMGWAYLNNSLTLGFHQSAFWSRLLYEIEEESLDEGESVREAKCITLKEHVDAPRIKGWIAAQREFENVPDPKPCTIPIEQKHIKYQEHHGKEILRDFCAKIVRHPFVQGVIDSIAFDSTTNRFILKCYPDGKIDLRLHWTPMGCGLQVQTTGESLPQTMKIAEMLEVIYNRTS